MTEPINVDDLRFLLSVAETGCTLSASKALKVSQSTVSRRIAALEADLCIQLFDKRRTGYVLTEAGAALIAPAEAVRQAVDAFPARSAVFLAKFQARFDSLPMTCSPTCC